MRGKEAYHCALLASKSKLAALVSGSGGIRATCLIRMTSATSRALAPPDAYERAKVLARMLQSGSEYVL